MVHRLELSLKDVTKKVKTYERVNILLAGLYYFYHNSALNRAVLQKTYEATKSQDEKLLIPTRVGGTRWIGHQVTAITHLITSYKFIVTHMEQVRTLYSNFDFIFFKKIVFTKVKMFLICFSI